MPITKSTKKALRQSLKRKEKNDSRKKEVKKLLKQANLLVEEKKKDEAINLLPKIYKAIDKATKVNVLKKNTASRKKAVISKRINRIA